MVIAAAIAALPLAAAGAAAGERKADPREFRATAECVMAEAPDQVRQLLGSLPGSSDEQRAAKRLASVYSSCSGDSFGLSLSNGTQGLYNGRADMAAAATSLALKSGRRALRPGEVKTWYLGSIAGRSPGNGYDAVALGMQEFGTCVVNAAPEASTDLVQSAAGSDAERRALDAIKPVLGGCVVTGKPISMKRDQLRLMIAEPLYHAIVDGPSAGRRS
jgi:hypothetical protein